MRAPPRAAPPPRSFRKAALHDPLLPSPLPSPADSGSGRPLRCAAGPASGTARRSRGRSSCRGRRRPRLHNLPASPLTLTRPVRPLPLPAIRPLPPAPADLPPGGRSPLAASSCAPTRAPCPARRRRRRMGGQGRGLPRACRRRSAARCSASSSTGTTRCRRGGVCATSALNGTPRVLLRESENLCRLWGRDLRPSPSSNQAVDDWLRQSLRVPALRGGRELPARCSPPVPFSAWDDACSTRPPRSPRRSARSRNLLRELPR